MSLPHEPNDLKAQVALGEGSCRQLKRDVTNIDGLAAEMVTSPLVAEISLR